MSEETTRGGSHQASRPTRYPPVSVETVIAEPPAANVEQRVAITLGVADGFKFGCGLLLAAIAFYFAVLLVVGFALVVAAVLGLPLPFGLGGR